MLFNSHEFILIFLPSMVVGYFLCNRLLSERCGAVLLTVASMIFACHMDLLNGLVLVGSVAINFLLSRSIFTASGSRRKKTLAVGLIFNVGILVFFKYTNFFLDGFAQLLGEEQPLLRVLLPLGISFYTFQQIGYLVDVYRGDTTPAGVLDYALTVCFFPKLVQGPICRHNELTPQFSDRCKKNFDFDNFSKALFLFAIGLTKKVMVADQFGKIVDYGFGHISSLNSFEAILSILAYTFQLYFDFSGYSDMAVGIGLMFNIELPQNFNSPYKALNISDFWKRWHMTLTNFLTKYIYIPLGGNRKGNMRTYLNILIVYLVSGLWHGTGFTFILWGLLHGFAMVLYRLLRSPYEKIPKALQWILTFIYINITWVFFRAGTVADAISMLRQVFIGGWTFYINPELTETLLQPTFISAASRFFTLPVVVVCGIAAAIFATAKMKNSTQRLMEFKPTVPTFIMTYVLLILSILSVSGVSTFLYTNF